jgi:hypothetical protein
MPVLRNRLSQELDVQGSVITSNTRALSDETNGIGSQISTGTGDTIGGTAPNMTLTDSGAAFTAQDVGRFLTISGATTPANDGSFLISSFTSGTVIGFQNAAGVAEAFTGTWTVTKPYALEDDLNFTRTDRKNIKGTASHVTDVPTYQRPTAVGTNVPANLTNIASKTTDAKALVVNRKFSAQSVASSNQYILLSDAGNLKHADAVDRTGIPIQDGSDAGAFEASYVEVVDPLTESALEVLGNAFGSITAITGALLVDGTDTFVLNDGVNPAVTFEFDDNSSVVQTATLRSVAFTAGDSASTVRDTIIAAINGAPTLAITASIAGPALVGLVNDAPGSVGNVAVTETVANAGFIVAGMSGGGVHTGKRIYARTRAGATGVSPNTVEAEFRMVVKGANLSTSIAYTWETGQPTTIDLFYGFRERLDNMSDTALRTVLTNGIVGDADLSQDILDIRSVLGVGDNVTSFNGLLTNTGNFFVFAGADATPSTIELFNLLNAGIGIRDYTGPYLTDGQTITASLQALSNAIAGSSMVRTIERLVADNDANVARTLPGAQSYTLDGTDNGQNMSLYWRGVLKDPGPVAGNNDYAETSTTSFTPYTKIRSGDHVNYIIYA